MNNISPTWIHRKVTCGRDDFFVNPVGEKTEEGVDGGDVPHDLVLRHRSIAVPLGHDAPGLPQQLHPGARHPTGHVHTPTLGTAHRSTTTKAFDD